MKKILLLFAFITLLQPAMAQQDVSVDIKNPSEIKLKYSKLQKAKLNLNFAKVYSKNYDWINYYRHISSIYNYCPSLKNSKLYIIRNNTKKDPPQELIHPSVIAKLNLLGINNIFSKNDSLTLLDLLSPLLEQKCID